MEGARKRVEIIEPEMQSQIFRTSKNKRVTKGRGEISGNLAHAIGDRQPGTHALMQFDFDLARILPRRLPLSHVHSSKERMMRKELWAKYGLPMHFFTLEFADREIEYEYELDGNRRHRRWVENGVLFRATLATVFLLYSVMKHDGGNIFHTIGQPCSSAALLILQYLQMKLDRDFVNRQFQHVAFFWAMLQAIAIVFFIWVVVPTTFDEEMCQSESRVPTKEQYKALMRVGSSVVESMTIFVIWSLIIYRMRFLYFFYICLILISGYVLCVVRSMLLYRNPHCEPFQIHMRHVLIVFMTLSCFSYVTNVLNRKDFVQAWMVHKESKNSEILLNNTLPSEVVQKLKMSRTSFAESYAAVTILFADVVSFTTMSAMVNPEELVELLNRMFLRFDDLAEKNAIEKIKTIGDCYMGAAGLPVENPHHAKTMARFALQMLVAMRTGEFKNPKTQEDLRVRVGIHSGPCVAGVIGHKKFAYDVWGDAVNTASRMESHGEPMRCHCSSDTYELLKDDFECEAREKMQVKGKGEMQTYFVLSEQTLARAKSWKATEQAGEDLVGSPTHLPSLNSAKRAASRRSSLLDTAAQLSRRLSSLGYEPGSESPSRMVTPTVTPQPSVSRDIELATKASEGHG